MRIYKYYQCIFIVAILLMASCSRDDQLIPVVTDVIAYPSDATNTSLTIRVQSLGRDLAGVTVSNGDLSHTTDENGIVVIRQARRTELGFTVRLKKEDYVSRTVLIPAVDNARHLVKVLQMDQISQTELTISEGSEILALGQAEISSTEAVFGTNSTANVGDVSLHFFAGRYDVSNSDAPLVSNTGSSQKVMHPSYSFTIEATAGQEAAALVDASYLDVVVSSEGLGGSTADVRLESYYLDPASGLLLPAPEFAFSGDVVSGRISKLGTYYLGTMHDAQYVETQLVNSSSAPLAYVETSISADGFVISSHTDDNGNLATYIKGNTDLAVTHKIGDENYTSLSPTNSPSQLEQGLVLDARTVELWGEYQDCEDASDFDGYVLYGANLVGTVSNEGNIIATVVVVDDNAEQQLSVISAVKGAKVSFVLPQNEGRLDIGVITVCLGGGSGGLSTVNGTILFDQDENGEGEINDLIGMLLEGKVLLYHNGVQQDSTVLVGSSYEFGFANLAVGRVYEIEFEFDNSLDSNEYYIYLGLPGQELSKVPGDKYARRWEITVENEDNISNQYIIAPNGPGTVSGRVMSDIDGDGVADLPLANVEIYLYKEILFTMIPDQAFASTTTDLNGYYEFANVPNRFYFIHMPIEDSTIIQEGDETPNAAEEVDNEVNGTIAVFLQKAEFDTDNNFLVQTNTIAADPGSISGFVRQDTDGDGQPDEDIEGALVTVYPRTMTIGIGGSALQSTTTAADGSYTLSNMAPGEYIVEVDPFPLASFNNLELLLDKDESPEADEPVDDGPPDGLIIVNVDPLTDDADNNAVVRIN